MDGLLYRQTWHSRVAELLDDPVAQALLRRDGLSRDDVMRQMAPVAEALNRHHRHTPGRGTPWAPAQRVGTPSPKGSP